MSEIQRITTVTDHLRACPDCDLLQNLPSLENGQSARCVRCGHTLHKKRANSLNRTLAYAITGLFLFLLSNVYPLLSLKAIGVYQDSSLFSATIALFNADRPALAVLVFLTTIAFPLFSLLGMIIVLLSIRMSRVHPVFVSFLARFLVRTEVWGMLDVFMLAILVATVKLGDLAEIILGTSLYAFIGLIAIMTLMSLSLDPEDIWKKVR